LLGACVYPDGEGAAIGNGLGRVGDARGPSIYSVSAFTAPLSKGMAIGFWDYWGDAVIASKYLWFIKAIGETP
jgi:hypothetical protein